MDITVDTRQMAELAEFWARAPDMTRKEMLRAATEIDLLVQGELQQHLPRGAGGMHGAGLVGGIHREERALANNVLGMVSTSKDYADYVEVGTKPHAPPIQPLKDWVEAKLGIREEKEATSVAWAIRKTIQKRGTDKQPVWADTYKAMLPKIQHKVEEGLARIRVRLAEGTP